MKAGGGRGVIIFEISFIDIQYMMTKIVMRNINYVFSLVNLVHYEPEAVCVSECEQYNTVPVHSRVV